MEYVIGVDAGGTKTSAAAFDLKGCRLAVHQAGPGNGTVDFSQAAANILSAVEGCIGKIHGRCVFLCIGMAGLDPLTGPGKLTELLTNRFGIECEVRSDAALALAAVHCGGDGLLVVSGTGSIAYGRKSGTVLRRGGWGHILGDSGSGYDIAIRAITAALQDFDDGLPDSQMALSLCARAGVGRLRALVEQVYREGKESIAALAPVVAESASAGDTRACVILRDAGSSLADLAAALNARLALPNPRVALAGGILEHMQPVRASFMQRLQQLIPDALICEEKLEPERAALILYKQGKGA
jgi:N-acetylglucosamine kinase-like BadF-type ATPase